MLSIKAGAGVFCAALFAASPAFAAVTVTNQDSKPHTIVVNNGTSSSNQTIAAGKSVQVDCPNDCGFRDEAFGFSRTAGGKSKLVIDKDGELHFLGGKGDEEMKNGTN